MLSNACTKGLVVRIKFLLCAPARLDYMWSCPRSRAPATGRPVRNTHPKQWDSFISRSARIYRRSHVHACDRAYTS